jgi:hypothetical protein
MFKKLSILSPISVFCAYLLASIPIAQAITITTGYSKNWSGYVITAHSPFTSVTATWAVPTVASAPAPSYSSTWIGIGGVYINSNQLVQAGTEQDVKPDGTKAYFAWYEVYPKFPVVAGDVAPGDFITTTVYKLSGSPPTWHITMTDTSTGTTLIDRDVRVKTNFAAEASAEFIVERPLIRVGNQLTPLADFGTVEFSNCTTNQGDLDSPAQATRVVMTDDGTSSGAVLASPSALSGNNFSVDWGT